MPRAPEPDPPGAPELPPGLIGVATPRAGAAYRLLRKLAMDSGRPIGTVAAELLAYAEVLKGKAP